MFFITYKCICFTFLSYQIMYCVFFFFLNRAMFTDGLVECQKDIISLNGVTAKGMKNLIDFAYSSKLFLDFGKFY